MKFVDLDPNLVSVDVRPTKANPDISVVIGSDNGRYRPKGILYPDEYTDDQITEKVRNYSAKSDSDCPVCNRYASEQRNRVMVIGVGGILIAVAVAVGVFLYRRRR